MNLKRLFFFIRRAYQPTSSTYSERVGKSDISVTMINSPFSEELTQQYLAQIGNYLAQALRTGQLPQIASNSHVSGCHSISQ